jgi:hypothetical protein
MRFVRLILSEYTRPQPATVAPHGKNRHGLDQHYFHEKLSQLLRDIGDYTPAEMARSLARYSVAADASVIHEAEFQPAPLAVPDEVMRALQRMETLHPSWLTGATAESDASCMKVISNFIRSLAVSPEQTAQQEGR